ncbi:MAG: ribose-phosphate pyrophosphokinase, partial [Bacillota bacterium]|nr:ribose-phosphate pyrophosphokinase [Bacillota bacterium]
MAIFHGSKVRIFSLSSNLQLAQEIADFVGIPLTESEVMRFADGEISINIGETVRGHKVFVIQSTSNPVNENLMELLIMIDALKRASAREINIVMPYYGYCRQDRKAKARQPISAKLVADLLTVAGATRVISVDLHAAQLQGFFNIPIDNFRAMPILASYIQSKNLENVCVVSPDHGGVARARTLADILMAPIAIIDKMRPEPNVAEVMNIIGRVRGKNCIIIDDMIDTAGSMVAAAAALKEAGA